MSLLAELMDALVTIHNTTSTLTDLTALLSGAYNTVLLHLLELRFWNLFFKL